MLGTAIGAAIHQTAPGNHHRKKPAFTPTKGPTRCDACPYCHSCRRTKVEKNR